MAQNNELDPALTISKVTEASVLENDCMKDALIAVGLDVLTLARQLKELVTAKKQPGIVAKGLDLSFKIRGDYEQASVDNRPININIPWGAEREPLTLEDVIEFVVGLSGPQQLKLKEALVNADGAN